MLEGGKRLTGEEVVVDRVAGQFHVVFERKFLHHPVPVRPDCLDAERKLEGDVPSGAPRGDAEKHLVFPVREELMRLPAAVGRKIAGKFFGESGAHVASAGVYFPYRAHELGCRALL